jgi:pimeloyl-ACP methyl ester carboxylesterase
METSEIKINLKGNATITADLQKPDDAKSLVIFAHGSGSSRLSPRNKYVAEILNSRKIATLLADLLTIGEDRIYENRFNISLLTERLVKITEWALIQPSLEYLSVGYFGASTGAAAALEAAAILNTNIKAVVSRGGRPDLAKAHLPKVKAPTLLIVGSLDVDVIKINQLAYDLLKCEKKIEIVEGASHLFEEPGTLDKVAELAANWFEQHLYVPALQNNSKQ